MKYLIVLILPLVSFASVLVDYGEKAQRGDYPSVVKISVLNQHDFFGLQELSSCSGSLLSSKIILTAAHCVHTYGKAYLSVSHAHDEVGVVLKDGVDKGLKVKSAFVNPRYYPAKKNYDEAMEKRNSRVYIEMTPAQRTALDQQIVALAAEMAVHDLAMIELSSTQKITSSEVAKMGCKQQLRKDSAIEFAGFGRNMIPGTLNANTNYVLLHGSNTLSKVSANLYHSNSVRSKQQVNSGDSGGPMYAQSMVNTVYGVSVMRINGDTPSTKESIFVKLSSQSSLRFFDEIRKSSTASAHLKSVMNQCF